MGCPDPRPSRPTIADVARAAGVSTAVVSYAVNDRPGVSAATRERVLRVAEEFGWRPSAAARSVRGGSRAVGLVVTDRHGALARDPTFIDLVTAARDTLRPHGLTLSVQVVDLDDDPARAYLAWWEERRFDVLALTDLLGDDDDVAALVRARAPVVVVGPSPVADVPAEIWFDEDEVATSVLRTVTGLGHRHVAVVTGPVALHRTRSRVDALGRAAVGHGVRLAHRETDATADGAAAATHDLLTEPGAPSALVLDGPVAALAGLDVARRCGLRVPWDVSMVAVGDSPLCRLASPPVTVVPLPAAALGAALGEAVLAVRAGGAPGRVVVPVGDLILRGSTGPFVPGPPAAATLSP